MNKPFPNNLEVDQDEYPLESTLVAIREADDWEGAQAWMLEVFPTFSEKVSYSSCRIEEAESSLGSPVKHICFSTGGWSGAEDFIEAVVGNLAIRALHYVEWKRGGHYVFEVGG